MCFLTNYITILVTFSALRKFRGPAAGPTRVAESVPKDMWLRSFTIYQRTCGFALSPSKTMRCAFQWGPSASRAPHVLSNYLTIMVTFSALRKFRGPAARPTRVAGSVPKDMCGFALSPSIKDHALRLSMGAFGRPRPAISANYLTILVMFFALRKFRGPAAGPTRDARSVPKNM
jgi:hypothetical protein